MPPSKPPARPPKSPAVQELHALAGDPAAQAAHAAQIVAECAAQPGKRHGKDALAAALKVLAERPAPQAHAALLELLRYYGGDKGVRDQGGYLRRLLLETLRPVAVHADALVLEQAASTYEFWPPDFAEDAVLLRATALVVLAEVDDESARYHAARLLVDPYVQEMSGEPAVSAARVLGALDELRVLWSYAHSEVPASRSEVLAECLRQLVGLRTELVPALIERFGKDARGPVQLGLVHLLIYHHAGPQGRPYLRRLLQETRDLDIYNYVVMSVVASGREPLLDDLLEAAQSATDRGKLQVLAEAFDLLRHQPRCAAMAQTLRTRLAGAKRNL